MKQVMQLGFLFIAMVVLLSSCAVVGGVFKAGVGVGIFIVVLVAILILWLVNRSRR